MAEKSSPTESNLHSAVPSGPYTDFLDEVGEMIFILNGQGTILYANGSVFDRLKLGRDLIIGKSFWEFLFPGEMRETAKNTRNRIKKMVRGRSIETTVKDKDGKKHLLSLRVVKLGGGKPGSLMLVARDITEELSLAQKLSKARDEYNLIVENLSDGLLRIDNGMVSGANGKAQQILGGDEDEIVGQRVENLLKGIEWETGMVKNIAGDSIKKTIFYRLDGSSFPAEIGFIRTKDIKKNSGFLLIRDITIKVERERMIRLMANVLETSKDAIIIMDDEKRITSVNGGYESIFGMAGESPIGMDFIDFLNDITDDGSASEMVRHLENRENWSGYTVIKTENGRRMDVSIKAWYIEKRANSGFKTVVHCRDISDRLSQERKTELLSSLLSHDIRNYDRAITDNLEMLKMGVYGDMNEKQEITINRTLKQAEDLNRLISDSKKILRSMERTDMEVVDIEEPLLSALNIVKSSYPEKDIVESVNLENGPNLVLADPLIKDVFQNIFDNSVKYSPDMVELNVKGYEKDNEIYRLEISDRGVGIDEKEKDLIFRKFHSSEENTGSGLGLYIVRNIMEMYGGYVDVKRRGEGENNGSTFLLDFRKPSITDPLKRQINEDGLYDISIEKYGNSLKLYIGDDVIYQGCLEGLSRKSLTNILGWNLAPGVHRAIDDIGENGKFHWDHKSNNFIKKVIKYET